MSERFDCIVAGLGAAGSATLHHLAARGARVVGFDAHTPPHTHGSSHGETRMIREAYFEDPCYVPLVRRAYDLWHELEDASGVRLIEETGGVYAGYDRDELIPGMRRAARDHDIPLVELTAAERTRRFPWLRPGDGMTVLTEPRAGLLHAERCITAQLGAATAHGAVICTGQPVVAWKADNDGVEVATENERYAANRLVLATGAWMADAAAAAGVRLTVARQPLFWFRSVDPAAARALPVWAVEFERGRLLYGFPDRGSGVKAAIHDPGSPTTPAAIKRRVDDGEVAALRELMDLYVPGIAGDLADTATCMYTNAPDGHFVIDTHPRHRNVLLLSACSGHGFKFSSAVGEAAARWMLDGAPGIDLSPFALARFS